MSDALKNPQLHPEDTPNARQAHAAHPLRSHWVGASAGTGKTKVLVDRLLRLMLPRPGMGAVSATLPARILCLTFTRTAAAEMAARVYEALSAWSVMEDDALDAALERLIDTPATDVMRAAARRLFARALDTPGGLKIMTIHSFCQSVLKRFPIEADLAPHFELMDEQSAVEYLTRCLHDMTAEARNNPESNIAKAFHHLALLLDSRAMSELMSKIMSRRNLLAEILNHHGSADAVIKAIYKELKIAPGTTGENILQTAMQIDHAHETDLRQAIAALTEGTKTDINKADRIQRFLDTKDIVLFEDYAGVYLTQKEEVAKRLATKTVVESYPQIEDVMRREASRILKIKNDLRAIKAAELNKSLLTVAAEMTTRYENFKKRMDRLDYEDLIIRTVALLSNAEDVQWVLFKLDAGIDHILVDEAQDTSPGQWQVIRRLSEEFFAGQGTREEVTRTLFVVGDEKQSIFSFQGADPGAFDKMRQYFGARLAELQTGNWVVELQHSFRSTSTVLSLVDDVFAQDAVRKGVVADISRSIEHLLYREGHGGVVEIWPLAEARDNKEKTPWRLPIETTQNDNAPALLAHKIAATIKDWLESGAMLPSKNRPIKAKDILILVQSRTVIVEPLLHALKETGVPVAGVDRMMLGEHIAVMDLLAVAQFALLPKDDLTLATILKSPLCGVSEEGLYELCYQRRRSLWAEVKDKRPDIAEILSTWIRRAGHATPYEFFAEILATPCPADPVSGRRGFYARLGTDIRDAMDEFLNQCLLFEQSHTPSLQRFIHWFEKGGLEIKREQDQGDLDQVRIMTVHASKGLQAPIVFLPDTGRMRHIHAQGRERLFWPDEAAGIPLWSPRKDYETSIYKERQNQHLALQDEEYRRLLYVAMTRAEDRLYVCGWQGKRKVDENCWYHLVSRAFPETAEKIPDGMSIEGTAQFIRRLEQPQTAPPKTEQVTDDMAVRIRQSLPDWAQQPPVNETFPPVPLAPSRPGEDEPAVKGPLSESDDWRFKRGIIVHQILEVLPQISSDKWEKTLATFLARPALKIPEQERDDFVNEILTVLRHPEFAPIFGPGSRAEVPVIGVTDKVVISGEIDRLLVTDADILIVDYKTNRPPPVDESGVAPLYLKQMAAYRQAIRGIYPNHCIKTALLWTDKPFLMPLSDKLLNPYAPGFTNP